MNERSSSEQTYPKITPVERDTMPREVATEFLANRFNRLSNCFRKRCQDAREVVYSSTHPIRLAMEIFNQPELNNRRLPEFGFVRASDGKVLPACAVRKNCIRVYDTTKSTYTDEVRFTRKLRTLPMAKLAQIRTRCDRRSDRMFKQHQKVLVGDGFQPPEKVQAKLLAHLDVQQKKFDFLHGLTTEEVRRRVARAEDN